ncbi:MAG: DMT family transporter [Proteobacteria bacterium]|nr:DMT family transporter [Pseudomonadota bacterium]
MIKSFDFRPYVMLIGAAVIYGSLFSVNKIAAEANWPPVSYAFWTSLFAGLALWLLAVARRAPPEWSWRHLRVYLVIGGLGIGFPTSLLTYVAPHLQAGVLTMVLALSPPFTYLISIGVRIERLYLLGVLGILFGFAGVAILVGPTAALPTADLVGWFLLSLLAPVCFACANVAAAVLRPPAATSVAMSAGILLGSAAIVAPFMLGLGQWSTPGGMGAGDWALLVSIAANCFIVVLFLEIVRVAGPTFFAQFNYLAVLAGIGWGALVFGERLGLGVWLALALMATGIILTALKERWPVGARST